MKTLKGLFLVAMLVAAALPARLTAQTTLDMYVIDVEGGNATLFVSPNHESLLIDAGNTGNQAPRDAGRIAEAIKAAGLTQIDHLLITHWHGDHYGAVAELAAQFPIREFIDHGANVQPAEGPDNFIKNVYMPLAEKGKHMVAKPGDTIAMNGVDIRVVASAGEMITKPLPGAGQPNPYCRSFQPAESNLEDPQSVAIHVTFGNFRTAHLGDLSKNEEFKLVCPNNLLGMVDVFLGLHHGVGTSNSPALLWALHPRVAVMNNGTRKGGDPETMKTIHSSPGLEDLWQLHFSMLSGQEYTVPGMFIANTVDAPEARPIDPITAPAPGPAAAPPPSHQGKAYWIKVSAQRDGTFTVTNTRNGFTKTYERLSK